MHAMVYMRSESMVDVGAECLSCPSTRKPAVVSGAEWEMGAGVVPVFVSLS